eukprot:scaffold6002_cov83-Skeletonema_marinoi.AAC.2
MSHMNLSIPVNQYQLVMMGNNQWVWMCVPEPLSLPLPEPTAIASNPLLGTWVSEPLSRSFMDRLAELKAFKEEHGHTNVPRGYPTNPQLGYWVKEQRTQYRLRREGKQSPMTNERIRELEAISFVWVLQAKGPQVKWEERLAQLKAFKEEHNHANVPQRYPTNPQLGIWVTTQRRDYRLRKEGKQSPMTNERIRELEAISFVWVLQVEVKWEERFAELKAFEKEHGHTNVPRGYPTNPQLGYWVVNQRTQYRLKKEGKHSHMRDERIRELEAIDFIWSIYDDIWDQMMAELAGYVEQANGINKIHHRDDLFGN